MIVRAALAVVGTCVLALLSLAWYTAATTSAGDATISLSPTPFPPPLTWAVVVAPDAPLSGSEVTVSVAASFDDGTIRARDASYTLHVDGDGLTPTSPLLVMRPELGEAAEWTFIAGPPGDVTVSVDLQYLLSYNFTGTPPGAYTVYGTLSDIDIQIAGLLGDADCGSTVDAIDAALVLQLNAGLIEMLPCQSSADVNKDGTVNAVDASLILQRLAGLIEAF